jgi:ABC-2 type transport system permease protein
MTAIPVPGAGRFSPARRALAGELAKGLLLIWQRRAMLVTATIALGVTYLMLGFFVGGGRLNQAVLTLTLPGLCAYTLASMAAVQGSGGIAEEVNGGTLEQSQLTPAASSLLVLARLGALAAEGLVPAAVLAAAFWAGLALHYDLRPAVLVPLLLTVTDALAYALLMIALTLAVASIGAVVHVFNMSIMFFGGMLVPVTVFPHGVEIAARFLPTTLGVQALNTTLAGGPLSAAWADGTLPWLLVHATATACLGWAAYLHTIRRARCEGGLSPR